jgi:hypothetical protein
MPPPKRLSTSRILALCAAALILLAGTFAGWLEWSTSRAWADLERRGLQLADREAAHPMRRVTLRSFDQPGAAWDDYRAALVAVAALPDPGDAMLRMQVQKADPMKRGQVRSALKAYDPALGLLSRGARRNGFGPSDRREFLSQDKPRLHLPAYRLAVAALCDIQSGPDEGDPAIYAVMRIRDILQFARDTAEVAGQEYAAAYMSILALLREFLGPCMGSDRLGPEELGVIEAFLRRLAEEPPEVEALLRRDLASTLQDAYRFGTSRGWRGMREAGLRHLFSARRDCLAVARLAEATVGEARGCEAWPASEVKRRQDEAYGRGDWEATALCFQGILILRMAQAEIRVMQAAVAWRLRGEIPVVADPCGTTLHASVRGDELTVWSNGWNVVDDGGTALDVVLRVRCR